MSSAWRRSGGSASARPRFAPARAFVRFVAVAGGLLVSIGAARAQPIRQDFFVPDGPVDAVVPMGNQVLIGGSFSELAYATGGGALIDASGDRVGGFPKITGRVLAVAPDGSEVVVTGVTEGFPAGDATVAFDGTTGKPLWHALHPGEGADAVGFSPDSATVFVAGSLYRDGYAYDTLAYGA